MRSNAIFCDDRYPRSKNLDWQLEEGIIKRRGASIGSNATILPGVTIGENAMVGAGAIVMQDVPAGQTITGTW